MLVGISSALQADADVVRESTISVANQHFDYVYRWADPEVKPRAVAVIVHGLTMHGLVYDAFARHLAKLGIIVYAPDLRGYGRWYKEVATFDNATIVHTDPAFLVSAPDFPQDSSIQQGSTFCQPMQNRKTPELRSEIDYDKSRADLLELVTALKNEHPDLPLYCMGESMGAGFAMYAAAEKPDCVDGLILSSPAIKRRLHLFSRVALDVSKGFASPKKELDLSRYIRCFASRDNQVIDEVLSDPLVRKRMSLVDLLKTLQAIRPNLKYAERIGANTPVLIIQGKDDQILRADAVMQLMAHLNTSDDTVRWFKHKGHLILETAYLQPDADALNTIDTWIERVLHNSHYSLPISVSYEIHEQLPAHCELAVYSN
jgi:alpha-beta hydrolase superfamily lysophospholipase